MGKKSIFHHLTHKIDSVVQADHIQADASDIQPENIFDASRGLNYIRFFFNITAPVGVDVTVAGKLFLEEDLDDFQTVELNTTWTEGIDVPAPITVAGGTTRAFATQLFQVGPGRAAFILTSCPDDTKIRVAGLRMAGDIVIQ